MKHARVFSIILVDETNSLVDKHTTNVQPTLKRSDKLCTKKRKCYSCIASVVIIVIIGTIVAWLASPPSTPPATSQGKIIVIQKECTD